MQHSIIMQNQKFLTTTKHCINLSKAFVYKSAVPKQHYGNNETVIFFTKTS